MVYPDDPNGNALRRLEAQGDDFARPRKIDFTVVFEDRESAEQFAQNFRGLGHEVSVEATQKDFPWDVVVVRYMTPSYEGICEFENLLESAASVLGGHIDVWGCFAEPPLVPRFETPESAS